MRILLPLGRFSKTNGRVYLVIYEVSVKYDAFGVVCEFAALHSILVFLGLILMKTLCFLRICLQTQSLLVFAESRAPTKNTCDIECAGSGAQEPDSTRNLMARGRDERPRAENHGFDLPCTRFYHFCKPETS